MMHFQILIMMYNRLRNNGLTIRGGYNGKDKGIKPTLKSSMLRYMMKRLILPIGHVQTKNAINKKTVINKHTEGQSVDLPESTISTRMEGAMAKGTPCH